MAALRKCCGFRRFSFRGLHKAEAVWALVCLVLNVKRLHGHPTTPLELLRHKLLAGTIGVVRPTRTLRDTDMSG